MSAAGQPRILVANRGEIAARVLRTCREQGYESVAVYSWADRDAAYLELADHRLCIGPAAAADSYNNPQNLLSALRATKAHALHPGYGFLSENAEFAQRVEELGVSWLGPKPETIRLSGNKAAARRFVASLGLPVIPGTARSIASKEELTSLANRLGYPLLLKATFGGGGRGMRRVLDPASLAGAFEQARTEAMQTTGTNQVYLERMVDRPMHVEVQLLGDGEGHVVAFADRHCSLQVRHQKVIEESPTTPIPRQLATRIRGFGEKIASALELRSVATVEFLVAADGRAYFLEINPRLQVEHGLTELIHGVDLVRAQLAVAGFDTDAERSAGRIPWLPIDEARGHAIECRLNAEQPYTGLPSPGWVEEARFPSGAGVRVDTYLDRGTFVPPYYDSLIAKIMTWAEDRMTAVRRMLSALDRVEVRGIETNLELLRTAVASEWFGEGRYDTSDLERLIDERSRTGRPPSRVET